MAARAVDRLLREKAELRALNTEPRQTNAHLKSRLAEFEAELKTLRHELNLRARQQQTLRHLEREIARLTERLQQYEPEISPSP